VWFSETEQKRNSLIDLYEASRSHHGSSRRKRSFGDNADHETARPKRQRLLYNEEAEFKYVTLADSVASLSTDQTESESEPESETQDITFDYAMRYIDEVKVSIPLCLLNGGNPPVISPTWTLANIRPLGVLL
jgi:hypothetical protein